MRLRNSEKIAERTVQVTSKDVPVYEDPFSYFADVIRRKVPVIKNSLYSIENNVTVVQILEAARESAKTGKTVVLKR